MTLHLILQKLQDSSYSRKELNILIENCFKIAEFHIRKNNFRLEKLLNTLSIRQEDLAVDAVAHLFSKDKEGKFSFLINSIEKWDTEISTVKDALYFLNVIIANKTSQMINDLFREADPFFDYFLDHINYLSHKFGFYKKYHLSSAYIIKENINLLKVKLITESEFALLPTDCFIDQKLILQNTFAYLSANGFYPAIPLNLLIYRLKEFHSPELHSGTESYIEQELDIDNMIKETGRTVNNKIDLTYLKSSKLTESETRNIKKTLTDIINDLKDGGLSCELYDYLSRHFTDLERAEYCSKYQNILEYLVKFIKKDIALKLKEYYSDNKQIQSI